MRTPLLGSPQARPDPEEAVGVARWLLAMICAAAYLGSQPGRSAGGWALAGLTGLVIVITPLVAKLSYRLLRAHSTQPIVISAAMQVLDTVGATGLVLAAGGLTPHTAWALLALPIVIAALRFGAFGVIATWAGACAGQILLLQVGLSPETTHAVLFERSGVLLALAAVVAVLTSWLQVGWLTQARLTTDARTRLDYVKTVEETGRAMRDTSIDEMLAQVSSSLLQLDFEAATVSRGDSVLVAVGDGDLVPVDLLIDVEPGVAQVISWVRDDDVAVRSISALEVQTGLVVSGWVTSDIGRAQIDAFGDLIAHASAHIELAEMISAVRHDAEHDPLTGLWRRQVFDNHIKTVAASADEVAVLFVDLDEFKYINDRFGHQIGDLALQTAAGRLRELVGTDGMVVRYGGDEFVVVLEGAAARHATELADKANVSISAPLIVDGNPIPLGATVGASYAVGPIDPDELIRQADGAVLASKAESKRPTEAPLDPVAPILPPPTSSAVHGGPTPSLVR